MDKDTQPLNDIEKMSNKEMMEKMIHYFKRHDEIKKIILTHFEELEFVEKEYEKLFAELNKRTNVVHTVNEVKGSA